MEETKIAIFKKKGIRKTLFQNEWWFSVVDGVEALTDSAKPSIYWSAMKARDDGSQLSTICKQLKLESSDGKKYETDCANTNRRYGHNDLWDDSQVELVRVEGEKALVRDTTGEFWVPAHKLDLTLE